MGAFSFRLERRDGSPADPPTFQSTIPSWQVGDRIFLGQGRTLRVVEVRPGAGPDDDPVLVVEEGKAAGDAA
jgi:hypothetical protein